MKPVLPGNRVAGSKTGQRFRLEKWQANAY